MHHLPLDVQPILTQFSNELKGISPDFVAGLYVTGSVVLDDFHPDKSDIDFVVVCENPDQHNLQSTLSQVHRRCEGNHKSAALNGVYLTHDHLDLKKSQQRKIFRYQNGRVEEVYFEMAPIVLYELITTGATVHGTDILMLPIQIELKDVHDFLQQNINAYWKNWVNIHSSFLKKKLLLVLFPRLTEWGILGVARQYNTLKTGGIASKTAAGDFCLAHVAEEYHPIIKEAIRIRNDKTKHLFALKNSYYIQPSLDRANATLACMREILSAFNREYNQMYGLQRKNVPE